MKEAIWYQRYNVNTFLVNPKKKLGLYGLLNLLQDAAWIHATHLGHGYENMLRDNTPGFSPDKSYAWKPGLTGEMTSNLKHGSDL
jgi:hypothetical protein